MKFGIATLGLLIQKSALRQSLVKSFNIQSPIVLQKIADYDSVAR